MKNTIQRDQETRVGQILAATPITKSFYTVAKMISNFAVLATMVAVMAMAAVIMQGLKAEDTHVHLWELLSPFLIFALPAVAFTAGLAVLFENIPGLRGGAGNVIYFFVWTALLAVPAATIDRGGKVSEAAYFSDFTGIVSVMGQMQQDLRSIDPTYKNGAALTIGDTATSKRFLWSGLRGTPALYWSRVTCVLATIALALLAAIFFHRFDPAREWRVTKASAENHAVANVDAPSLPQQTAVHLTPVARTAGINTCCGLFRAEMKLMLKGQAGGGTRAPQLSSSRV